MTDVHSCSYYCDRPECIKAQRDELRERLAQPEQEPVAWVCYGASEKHDIDYFQDEVDAIPVGTQLYASPPPQRKPLTDEQIEKCFAESDGTFVSAGRVIEAAHGIKENT